MIFIADPANCLGHAISSPFTSIANTVTATPGFELVPDRGIVDGLLDPACERFYRHRAKRARERAPRELEVRCDWEWVQSVLQKVRLCAEVGHRSPLNDLVVDDKN